MERGFRFDFNGQIIDVLAPDGLGPSGATTTGKLKTIQIPGGTQALDRTELVEIVVDELAVTLRRPKLIAAILLKARALRVHSRPQDQRYDLITILSLLDDPRTARAEITSKESGWLRSISGRLSIDDLTLRESFEATRLRAGLSRADGVNRPDGRKRYLRRFLTNPVSYQFSYQSERNWWNLTDLIWLYRAKFI